MELYAVKINGITNPVGYLLDSVLCSWKVRNAQGSKQSYAKIEVSLSEAFEDVIYVLEGDLASLGTKLDMQLSPRTRYYYRVTVQSDAGEIAVSDTCFFETGKLNEPWQAQWIGMPQDGSFHPEFRKCFDLSKEVRQARLYICGLGVFEAYLGDKKIGDDLLAPFINDYQEHFQYCTYDVTGLLQQKNELTVLLGKGWYLGKFGLACMAHPERPFALIAELHIGYKDGSCEVIASEESWQYRNSYVTFSDIYDGETQNYMVPHKEWKQPGFVDAPGRLTERYSPSVKAMERLPVREVIHTPAGETVLDFGQNFAGIVECNQYLTVGTKMKLEFGEILQNGNFYHDNYRSAKTEFTYISDGNQRTIRPHFTFFGFRYVKVSGLEHVDPDCFTGRAVYSEMDRVGYLTTGNEKINKLHENTVWGLKSNFLDMPTDCPQRDERLGWTGDAMVFSTTAGYLMDTRAFYNKFLRDLRSDQVRMDGRVAIFLPNDFAGLTSSVWSDIGTFLPKMLHTYYGSKDTLVQHYPLMRDWVECVRRQDQARGEKFLWDFGFHFGDWLSLDGPTEQSTFGRTDNHYVSSIYYYASTSYVAEAAALLGLPEAGEYATLAENIRKAILSEYFTLTGRLAIDTQTGYLLALRFGIYHDKQKIIDGFKNRFTKDCRHLKGGFVGATMMNTVLADNGMEDIAYDLLCYEGFPGWLYAVNLGATTIWERWNSVLPDGSISGTGMNSLNHYSYGSIMEFMYRHGAGIQPVTPGFGRVRLAPKPDVRLEKLSCEYNSAAGRYVSEWEIHSDGTLRFHFEIPFGCEAEICLPEQESVTVKSGSYDYTIRTKKDYRSLYHGDTPVRTLLEDARAVAVLDQYLPGTAQGVDRSDAEAMSKSLYDMQRRAALFRAPTAPFDAAISALAEIRFCGTK